MISIKRTIVLSCSLITFAILSLVSQVCLAGKVLDVGDKLPELLQKHPDKSWLMKFYAPWCHHCQQLEPTYNNVAERIYHEHDHLIVGRVDCTKYGKICEEFKIDSYPTIMFVSNDLRVKYKGDRSEESMVTFAERLNGPSIHFINSCDQLNNALSKHELILLSTITGESSLKEAYESIAKTHKSDYWFYQFVKNRPERCANYIINKEGLYLLKKDLDKAIRFNETSQEKMDTNDGNESRLEQDELILDWITSESFPVYGRISSRNIEQRLATGRILVLAVLDEYKPARSLSPNSQRFHKKFEKLAISFAQQENNHNQLLFGWTSDLELIEYITLSPVKTTPNVIILNRDFSYHLLIEEELPVEEDKANIPKSLTEHNIAKLISNIKKGKLELSGGNTYLHVILRYTLGNLNKFKSMYRANPLLVSLVFGFPSAILIFVVYTTCFYEDNDVEKSKHLLSDEDDDDEAAAFDSDEDQRLLSSDGQHLKQD